jgi:hypothetical protein
MAGLRRRDTRPLPGDAQRALYRRAFISESSNFRNELSTRSFKGVSVKAGEFFRADGRGRGGGDSTATGIGFVAQLDNASTLAISAAFLFFIGMLLRFDVGQCLSGVRCLPLAPRGLDATLELRVLGRQRSVCLGVVATLPEGAGAEGHQEHQAVDG